MRNHHESQTFSSLHHKADLLLAAILIFNGPGAAIAQQQPKTLPCQPPTISSRPRRIPATEAEIQEAKALLAKLGYWLLSDAAGADASFRHALIAFQKVEDRNCTGELGWDDLEALRIAQPPAPVEPGYTHIEVDLQRQVLFFVEESSTLMRILPVSTGSGELFTEGGITRRAITPIGRFKVQRKIEGWRKSPLGLLYYPNYFFDGVAIHGNPSVPVFPASHGCIRIPMFAAKEFSQLAVLGLPVIVHDGGLAPLP